MSTPEAKPPMSLRAMADQLRKIADEKHAAEAELVGLVQNCLKTYNAFDRAHDAAVRMDSAGALGGEQARELRELCERLQSARELLAEAAFAASAQSSGPAQFTQWLRIMEAPAREGMKAKRLAKWEADALREAAVEALAGKR